MQPSRPGRRRSAGPGWAGPAGPAVAGLLGLAGWARRVRLLDHTGTSYRARVTVTPQGPPTGVPFLDRPGSLAATVRFSRTLGVPEPLPDLLRLAIRLIDAHGPAHHQDLVLTSSSGVPGGRHLLIPATGFIGHTFSSVIPYLVGGRIRVFGAVPVSPPVHDGGTALAEVHVAARRGGLALDLALAGGVGTWRPLGRVSVGDVVDDGEGDAVPIVDFRPWRPGPGIRPAGPLPALSGGLTRW